MNILVTNDDGYGSEGIKVLTDRLKKDYKVYVVAPDSQRSAVSSHFSIFCNNTVKKMAENEYTCSGFPADCVFTGLESNLFNVKFDAVISGINRGANIGTDVVYSGTCAAARQAVLNGIPGIALSIRDDKEGVADDEGYKYQALADFAAKNLKELIKLSDCTPGPKSTFVNVNALSLDSYKGVKCTSATTLREYDDSIQIIQTPEATVAKFIPGLACKNGVEETEYEICQKGFISITRLYAEPVAAPVVDGVRFSL